MSGVFDPAAGDAGAGEVARLLVCVALDPARR
jgi:hypothetical protein